jgi:hypothetical protein
LFADQAELVLGQLLALQDALEVEEGLEALLHGRIEGVVGELAACVRDERVEVSVQSRQVHLLRLRELEGGSGSGIRLCLSAVLLDSDASWELTDWAPMLGPGL